MSQEMIWGLVGFAASFMVAQVWEALKENKAEAKQELRGELKKNTEAVLTLTLAIQKLELELNHLTEKTDKIPELEKDLNLLGAKVRAASQNT